VEKEILKMMSQKHISKTNVVAVLRSSSTVRKRLTISIDSRTEGVEVEAARPPSTVSVVRLEHAGVVGRAVGGDLWEERVVNTVTVYCHRVTGQVVWDRPAASVQGKLWESRAEDDTASLPILTREAVKIFKLLDIDGNGAITKRELMRKLRKDKTVRDSLRRSKQLKLLLKPQRFAKAFELIDTSHDGTISLVEFVAFVESEVCAEEEEATKGKKVKQRTVVIGVETQDVLGLRDAGHAKEVMAHLAVASFETDKDTGALRLHFSDREHRVEALAWIQEEGNRLAEKAEKAEKAKKAKKAEKAEKEEKEKAENARLGEETKTATETVKETKMETNTESAKETKTGKEEAATMDWLQRRKLEAKADKDKAAVTVVQQAPPPQHDVGFLLFQAFVEGRTGGSTTINDTDRDQIEAARVRYGVGEQKANDLIKRLNLVHRTSADEAYEKQAAAAAAAAAAVAAEVRVFGHTAFTDAGAADTADAAAAEAAAAAAKAAEWQRAEEVETLAADVDTFYRQIGEEGDGNDADRAAVNAARPASKTRLAGGGGGTIDWVRIKNRSTGKVMYYKHKVTGEISWERPDLSAGAAAGGAGGRGSVSSSASSAPSASSRGASPTKSRSGEKTSPPGNKRGKGKHGTHGKHHGKNTSVVRRPLRPGSRIGTAGGGGSRYSDEEEALASAMADMERKADNEETSALTVIAATGGPVTTPFPKPSQSLAPQDPAPNNPEREEEGETRTPGFFRHREETPTPPTLPALPLQDAAVPWEHRARQ
jgi:Ca2+-binding EF-hand superfamily protein